MVKIAVIGAGFMGKTHGTAYGNISGAQLAAVCDKDEKLGKEFAEEYGCRYYQNFEEMADSCDFDVADICVPTYLHEGYVEMAAKYKKHIFCEKPVTLSVNSLDRMMGAAREAGVIMMIGQVLRFWPEYVTAKSLYAGGELGELNYVHAARLAEHPAWSEWYRRPENSGGGLLDLHLHDIDYLCYLLGKVKSVYSAGRKNSYGCWNYVSSILTFESGMTALAEGVIEMEKGYPFTMELLLVGNKKTYEYRMKAGANLEDIASSVRDSKIYDDGTITKLPLDETDAYGTELAHFVDCIQNSRPSDVIDIEDVRNVLCTIEALRTSLETGDKVKVDYGARRGVR